MRLERLVRSVGSVRFTKFQASLVRPRVSDMNSIHNVWCIDAITNIRI